jgi:hypothetical protein
MGATAGAVERADWWVGEAAGGVGKQAEHSGAKNCPRGVGKCLIAVDIW